MVEDVVWIYFGVWFFYNDGVFSVMVVMWDYVLWVNKDGGVLIFNVFGGKIMMYWCLVELVLEEIGIFFSGFLDKWMVGVLLVGGDFVIDGVEVLMV